MEDKLSIDVQNSVRRCSYDRRPSAAPPCLVIADSNGNGAIISGAQLLEQKAVAMMCAQEKDHPGVNDVTVRRSVSTAEQRTLDIVYQFLVTTTAHGWAHVARGYNTPVKTFWLFITLLAFSVNVTHVVVLVAQYLRYPFEQVRDDCVSFI
jgi:Amiloride-sensitive sodium channel